MHAFLVHDLGFIDLKTANCIYAYITSNGEVVLVGLFVDDTYATYNSSIICWFARRFSARFGTKWFGGLQGFIGAHSISPAASRAPRGIFCWRKVSIKTNQFQLKKTTDDFLSCDHSIPPAASRAPRTRCSSYAVLSQFIFFFKF